MAEPLTFLQLVHLYRQQFGYGVVAGVLAALLTACSINTEDWGYLTSVGIGVFGWNTVKRVLAVKFPSLNSTAGDKQNG